MSATPRRTTRPIGMAPKPKTDIKEEATQNDIDNDPEDQAERDPAEQEAESVMESIKDKPEVCRALYTMLEEEYGDVDKKEIDPNDVVDELSGDDEEGLEG